MPIIFLVAYIVILIQVMVFKDLPTLKIGQLMLNFSGTDAGHGPNFVPFATIVPYLLGYRGWIIAGVNLVGNVALLVPLGILFSLICLNNTWKKSFFLAVASGLSIEILQTMLRVGIFDIDDVILNALGFMVGYWVLIILSKWMREKKYRNILISALIVITVCVAALYSIYPRYEPVVDPNIAERFESAVLQENDLCGGTGGTGVIVSKGDHAITIKGKNGAPQVVTLTDKTSIKNSEGVATEAGLKIGDRVTVVIDESETASVVLVCMVKSEI